MAKTLYFTNAVASTHRGNNDANLASAATWWTALRMDELRGGDTTGARTVAALPVTGPTNGVEYRDASTGTTKLEWLSEPLSADFTISGTITINMWAFEALMTDNVAINAVIDKVDGATGTITQIAKSVNATELGTTSPPAAASNFTVTPTSTACKRGDRLRVRAFIDDGGGTMVAGGSVSSFWYDRSTASVLGDSWVQFTENLTFEPAMTLYQPGGTTAAVFGNATISYQAQPFVAPSSSLFELRIFLAKTGLPTDNLQIDIQTDSAGSPSGTVVGTVATPTGGSLTTSLLQYTYSNIGLALTAGSTYWIVVSRTGAQDAANYFSVGREAVAVANWTVSKNFSSGAWSANAGPFALTIIFQPGGSRYYLTDTAETINPGGATEKKALTTRGSSSVNAITNTAAGPITPTQITATAGGTAIEWYTPPLEAVTFGGRAKVNIRGLESSASANASLKAEIAITATDGSGAAVWGIANLDAVNTFGEIGEISTTSNAYSAWVAGDDTAVTAGQRLRVRIFVDDCGTAPLVTAFTVTISYSGPTVSATGDTYVVLPVAVTEQVAGIAWTQPVDDTLSLSDAAATVSGRTAAPVDTLTLADATALVADYQRAAADTVTPTDATAFDQAHTLLETVAVADATTVARDIAQAVADTVGVGDSAAPATGKGVTVADTVTVGDAVRFDRGLTLAETVALTDVVAQAEEIHIGDTLAVADSASPSLGVGGVAHSQPVADTLALTDSVQFGRAFAVADTVALVDALSLQAAFVLSIADTVVLADAIGFTRARLAATSLTLTVSATTTGTVTAPTVTTWYGTSTVPLRVFIDVRAHAFDFIMPPDPVDEDAFVLTPRPVSPIAEDDFVLTPSVPGEFG